jgi:hypothetical protein
MPYSDHQQTFALSMASNLAMDLTGTPEALQALLTQSIQDFLADPLVAAAMPGWTVAWGPFIWQAENSSRCDLAMVVFTNGATDVVAIGATSRASWYDWLVEGANVSVKQPVAWPGMPTGAWISDGTLLGLNRLLDMPFPSSAGARLVDFLRGRAGKERTLIVAGHSLAGALAPTLAVELFTRSGLPLDAWRSVRVFPTAGYSPGDREFAEFFAELFPSSDADGDVAYAVWNKLIWNDHDVVPRAWDIDTLTGLPTLYGATLEPLDRAEVTLLQFAANELAGPGYCQLQSEALTHHVTSPVTTLDDFLREASYQHIEAYFYLFEVPELLKFLLGKGNPPPPPPPAPTPKRAQTAAIAQAMATHLS